MANSFKIKVKDHIFNVEEGLKYFIKVKDDFMIEGEIIENMSFKFENLQFFYILDEKSGEDYQIVENEIEEIKKI